MLATAFLMAAPAVAPIHEPVAGPVAAPGPDERNSAQAGIATWYGSEFHGLETANGEIFDMFQLTAAHRQLPMGAWVLVTHLENHKSVVVRINDRGPVPTSAVIDLSYAAAKQLGMTESGRARVRLNSTILLAWERGRPARPQSAQDAAASSIGSSKTAPRSVVRDLPESN